jgi:hypothetical membrane protein
VNDLRQRIRAMKNLPSLLGILAIIAAWITIILAISVNPWFRLTSNALSDLGGGNLINNGHPSPAYPEIYNYGMIITGVLIGFFSLSMIEKVQNKGEIIGFSFFIIGGLFLALIGIYHEGTYPHDFVSIWFFIISSISFFVVGIASLSKKYYRFGIALIGINLLSWIAYSVIPWQSVAEDEIFGVLVIDLLVIITLYSFSKRWAADGTFKMM